MNSSKINVKCSKYEKSEAIRRNKMYWKNVIAQLDKDKEELDAYELKDLSRELSSDLCERVYEILDYDMVQQSNDKIAAKTEQTTSKIRREPLFSKRKAIVIERELESDTDVEISSSDDEPKGINIHRQFLDKPEREQITWKTRFLQPEREDEKSLIKRANDLTERITQDFCEYMKDLGGDQQSQLFTPKCIKELFQVEFDTHVARSLQVVPKEMPTVINKIAEVTGNIELSRNAALAREITKDIKIEKRPDRLTAFGRSLPKREQWRTPQNDTKNQWRSAKHVPRDLVSLKTVWEGITNIRSVREYCRWMIQHPEHRRAPYLNSLGMFDPSVLNARLTMELQHPASPTTQNNTPAPIGHLRRRLSQLTDTN
ncbi:PREDICTED: uncharacterized protein LOC106100410 [Papilio polytes]|uniref:uncharacterized protein LOC106100410 n=1 Tax=Papilio polytes TaxID=76194 RepID=UPI000675CCF6|nr:PREDICTED: uncharacterized protein LOC106100410 [Papilio polytes]